MSSIRNSVIYSGSVQINPGAKEKSKKADHFHIQMIRTLDRILIVGKCNLRIESPLSTDL